MYIYICVCIYIYIYIYIYTHTHTHRQHDFIEFPSATCNVAADTGYVISFVSSQHEVDTVSIYCSIALYSVSRILLFLILVYVPVLRVFMSVGSVATELAETCTKSYHVEAAAGTLFSKTRSHVIQRRPGSNERLMARIVNTYINSRNLINTIQNNTAVHTGVEVLQNKWNVLMYLRHKLTLMKTAKLE